MMAEDNVFLCEGGIGHEFKSLLVFRYSGCWSRLGFVDLLLFFFLNWGFERDGEAGGVLKSMGKRGEASEGVGGSGR